MSETRLAQIDEALAGVPLPRDNGELVFDEPWQGRLLGMAVVVLERTGATWADFAGHLAVAIAARPYDPGEPPATAYYSALLEALEAFATERHLV
jgi:hypothetical protein